MCKKMRFFSFYVAFCVSLAVVYCLPNAHTYKDDEGTYLELAREIADELMEEKQIQNAYEPPYKNIEEDNFENARDLMSRVEEKSERENEPPYVDTEIDGYIQVAEEVADQYVQEQRENNKGSNIEAGFMTASEALSAFNRPSKRTQRIAEEFERENAELETLMMLASHKDNKMLRKLSDIDLTSKKVIDDPHCTINIDCSDTANRNFVDGIEFRTSDGSCNNLFNYTWGMAGTQHRRLLHDAYADGKWKIRSLSANSTRRPRNDVFLPSARNVSSVVHNSTGSKPDNVDAISIALFYFMQFIDHDLAKTPEGHVGNGKDCCKGNPGKTFCMPIKVDVPDDHFSLNYCMDAKRSFTLRRCNDDTGFQNQLNEITAYVDASMVYGSSEEEERLLRTYKGGYLKESTRSFMPNSTRPSQLACNISAPDLCYEAGDTRADVHPGLTSYHTVFVRQHNRIAKQFTEIRTWSDERIYQETRKIIGAQIQHIVYGEMLPILIRNAELTKYNVTADYVYDPSIDASMTQAFSMAFRYHNLMPHALHIAKLTGSTVTNYRQVNQESVIMNTSYIAGNSYEGIDEVTLGMVVSSCPYVNRLMNNATRNLLFLDKFGNSFDLVALNLMRGREWGMPSYTEYRALCGLGNATTWDDLLNTTDADTIAKLRQVYPNVTDIDLWTGIMTERKLSGSISGPTQSCLLAKHFGNLKHGDRFFYQNSTVFTQNQRQQIETKTSLARILCDNLDVTKMRINPFSTNSGWTSCDGNNIPSGNIDLSFW